MRALVEQGMRDGAFGLSSSLIYVPGNFAPTSEIVELAKGAGRLGGHYQSHIRDEGGRIVEAVQEAITIGEQAGLPAQVTHHKAVSQPNWGKSVDTLRLISAARARGVTSRASPSRAIPGDGGGAWRYSRPSFSARQSKTSRSGELNEVRAAKSRT